MADDSELLTFNADGSSVVTSFEEIQTAIDAVLASVEALQTEFSGLNVGLTDNTDILNLLYDGFTKLDDRLVEVTDQLSTLNETAIQSAESLSELTASADEAATATETVGSGSTGAQAGLLMIAFAAEQVASKFLGMGMQAQNSFAQVVGMAGVSSQELQQYQGQLEQQAQSLGITLDQEGAALYQVESAGYDLANGGLKVLEESQKEAAAAMNDAGVDASALTSILHAYNLSAQQAGGVSDKMVKTVVVGKQSFNELASAIGPLAAVGHNVGLSLSEVLAAEATMTQINPNVRMDVNELKFLFNAMSLSVQGVAHNAKKLKLSFDENHYTSLDLIGRLQYLAQVAGGTNTEAFKKLVGGAAGMQAALILLSGKSQSYVNDLKQIQNSQGATDHAFEVSEQTIQAHVNHVGSALSILATHVTNAVAPEINGALQGIEHIFDNVTSFIDSHTEMVMPILAGLATMIGVTLVGAFIALAGPVVAASAPFLIFAAVAGTAVALLGSQVADAFSSMADSATAHSLRMKEAVITNQEQQAKDVVAACEDEKTQILRQMGETRDSAERAALEQRLKVVDQQEQEAQQRIKAAEKEKQGVLDQLSQVDPQVREQMLKTKGQATKTTLEQAQGVAANYETQRQDILNLLRRTHDEHTRHFLQMKLEAIQNAEEQANKVVAQAQKQHDGILKQLRDTQQQMDKAKNNPFSGILSSLSKDEKPVMDFLHQMGDVLTQKVLPPLEHLGQDAEQATAHFLDWLNSSGTLKDTLDSLGNIISFTATVVGGLVDGIATLIGWLTNGGPQTYIFIGAITALAVAFAALKIMDIVAGFDQLITRIMENGGLIGLLKDLANTIKDKVAQAWDSFLSNQAPHLKKALDDTKQSADGASQSVEDIGTKAEESAATTEAAATTMETDITTVGTEAETTATEVESIGTAAQTAEGEVATSTASMDAQIASVGTSAEATAGEQGIGAIAPAAETAATDVGAATGEMAAGFAVGGPVGMAVAALAPFIIGTLNDAAKQSADDMINGLVSELKAKQPQVDQAAQAQAQAIEQIFLQMGSDLANQIETILLSIFDPARYQAYLSMGEQNGPAVPTGPDPQGSSHGSGGKHGMPGHAKGIVNSPHGHLSVTGEEGRELTWIPQGGSVFPHDITEMIMSLISNPIPIPVPSGMSSGSSSGDTQALLSEQRKTNALLQAILEASGNNASSGDIHVHGIADMQSLWQSLNKTGGFQWEYGNRGAGW